MKELQAEIKSKSLKHLYIFTGQEVGIMDVYMDQMRTIADYQRVDDIASIIPNIATKGLLSAKRSNYIVRDDMDFLKNGDVVALTQMLETSNCRMIIIYSSIDKRTSLWKKHKDKIVEFEPLDARVLAKYIERDIALPTKQADMLARMCDCNYSRIMLECDKIAQYADANNLDVVESFYKLSEYGMIYTDAKDVVFEFIDAMTTRKPKLAYSKLHEMKIFGSNAIGALTLMYNNFKALSVVQMLGSTKDIEQRTGVPYWHAKNNADKVGNYSVDELLSILASIQFVDKGIKSGLIDVSLALDVLVARVFGGV